MDKKKTGIKLKKETSVTGTGASVTPGTGDGVATKYAFGKRDNKGTPKDWKSAPSIPNRPSKAMDYKELWEAGEYNSLVSVLKQLGAEEDSVKVLIKAIEMGALKPTDAIKIVKKALGKKEEIEEGYGHIRHVASDLQNLYYYSDNEAFKKAILDVIPSGDKYQYYLDKPEKYIQKLESLKQMLPQAKVANISGAMNVIDKAIEFFQNKETLQEGYAQFRNATKTRSKPDQFHQAVKEIKKKMNEINRIFEYVDRLKTELSEGEDLKYKKYTENAFQQIKESAKSLFLKSTKLK